MTQRSTSQAIESEGFSAGLGMLLSLTAGALGLGVVIGRYAVPSRPAPSSGFRQMPSGAPWGEPSIVPSKYQGDGQRLPLRCEDRVDDEVGQTAYCAFQFEDVNGVEFVQMRDWLYAQNPATQWCVLARLWNSIRVIDQSVSGPAARERQHQFLALVERAADDWQARGSIARAATPSERVVLNGMLMSMTPGERMRLFVLSILPFMRGEFGCTPRSGGTVQLVGPSFFPTRTSSLNSEAAKNINPKRLWK